MLWRALLLVHLSKRTPLMSKTTLSTGGQLDWLLQSMTDDIKVARFRNSIFVSSEIKQIKRSNLGNNLQLRDRVDAESMAFVAVDRDTLDVEYNVPIDVVEAVVVVVVLVVYCIRAVDGAGIVGVVGVAVGDVGLVGRWC
nr:hypothetical transcript [Hymenolepis microstoma]